MTEAKMVMDNFMKKLSADSYRKENQPNNGPEINLDFIDRQLMSYSKLLRSGVIGKALGERGDRFMLKTKQEQQKFCREF